MTKVHTCFFCGRPFKATRQDATCCSAKCRTGLSRARRKIQTRSINGLPPQAIAMLNDLKNVSTAAFNRIMKQISDQGAASAETAIYAAWDAANDCITYMSKKGE